MIKSLNPPYNLYIRCSRQSSGNRCSYGE